MYAGVEIGLRSVTDCTVGTSRAAPGTCRSIRLLLDRYSFQCYNQFDNPFYRGLRET